MNPPETQSDSSSQETYFDPEGLDTSEQEFSASLEHRDDGLEFVVESPGDPTKVEEGTHSLITTDADSERNAPDISSPLDKLSESPDCQADEPCESDWRDQVSAKVKHYKTLKPRKDRYPSLQLQFDSVVSWKSDKPSLSSERADFFASPPADAPPAFFEPEPGFSYPASTEATARVLEFPRPGTLPFNRDELAEPMIDRPRIMEAPDLLPPPPALGGILIEPVREPEPERQAGVDMPLQTAGFSRRVFAGATDGFLVVGALAIFGYIFLRFNTSLPQLRVAAEIAAALTVTLWFAYQSVFLIFCGTTPGLRVTRLKITRFDGTPAPRNLRRLRVLASVLSFVSLGLGYAWGFLDEDQLSWHDRITKTHLAPRR